MLRDKTKIKATNKMWLKHNLWPEASEMNIVPNMQLGTSNNCISLVADNLVKNPANKNNNYWPPLSCLVKEQEDKEVEQMSANQLLSAVTDFQASKFQNKIAAK
jgi:hypothetical protein